MRNFWTYALLLLAALAGGAFLWGLAYALWLPPIPHHKLVKYGALLTAVLVLALWAHRRMTRIDLGLQGRTKTLLVQALTAFAAMVALLMPLWLFLLMQDARLLDAWAWSPETGYKLAAYLLGAVAVATVEELYFRGLLLSRAPGYWMPLLASALLYAGIHFLNPTAEPALGGHWDGGWTLLANATFEMPGQWLEHLPRLCLLFLIGFGLGMLRLRFNRLAFCIGIHAAMVFSLKLFQSFTHPGASTSTWLGTDALGGWAGAVWIGVLVIGLWFCFLLSRGFFQKRV